MSHRKLMRIPLDFNAPLNKVWSGYINPYPRPTNCQSCDGWGYNTATKQISDDWYDMAETGRDIRYEGVPVSWAREAGRRNPDLYWPALLFGWHHYLTQDEVDALDAEYRFHNHNYDHEKKEWVRTAPCPTAVELNKAYLTGMGHDGCNKNICVEVRAKRLGVWGTCPFCEKGEIHNPDEKLRKLYDEWRRTEPPVGEGWQLWSTSGEGSPITPVFSTKEKLADYCEENATICGKEYLTYEEWLDIFTEDTAEVGSLVTMKEGKMVPLCRVKTP